jgi:hypothetical protein
VRPSRWNGSRSQRRRYELHRRRVLALPRSANRGRDPGTPTTHRGETNANDCMADNARTTTRTTGYFGWASRAFGPSGVRQPLPDIGRQAESAAAGAISLRTNAGNEKRGCGITRKTAGPTSRTLASR